MEFLCSHIHFNFKPFCAKTIRSFEENCFNVPTTNNFLQTLNALQNDLIWLLLHSWFSEFFGGGPPYKRYTWKRVWTGFTD